MNQTKKRLQIINIAISLTDIETIQLQILKLAALRSDPKLQEIIAGLQAQNYAQTQALITKYIETPMEEIVQRTPQNDQEIIEEFLLEKGYRVDCFYDGEEALEAAMAERYDMLLLDGGKGQLGIGVEVLADFDLLDRIDLVAIAKEKQEEGEKLFRPGRKNPILLPAHAPALLYLMRIRDESHRFGITFHRRLRRKNTLRSPLDRVTGIGAQRKKALLRTLGSYKRIQSATAEELATAPGIGPVLAKSIFRQLHPENEKKHAA